MSYFFLIVCFLISGVFSAFAQSAQVDNLVRNRLKRVALGFGSEVRKELPDLLAEFPDEPGVKLLHAVLVEDANKALPMFEKIVRDSPKSEWADDAQWRVVQIYALRKDTVRAREELQKYRKSYPNSEFLLNAAETVEQSVGTKFRAEETKIAATEKKSPKTETVKTPTKEKETPKKTESSEKKIGIKPNEHVEPKKEVKKEEPKKEVKKEEPKKEVKKEEEPKKEASGKEKYTLQVGLYASHESAEGEVGKFTKGRLRANIVEKTIGGEKKFAVIIGEYSTREAAEKAKPTVQKYCECTPFIVLK